MNFESISVFAIASLLVSSAGSLFAGGEPESCARLQDDAGDENEEPRGNGQPAPAGTPCPHAGLPAQVFAGPAANDWHDDLQKAKPKFRLGAGAYHWFNLQRETGEFTYGFPGAEGTYFYHLDGDIEHRFSGANALAFHAELRLRDKSTFRTFFDNKVWFYELYGSFKTKYGAIKAGKVWNRFGLDWDGSFWGNVPYYDGFKLDPDWGISWEQTWMAGEAFSLDSFAQFNMREDEVNGSLEGGDAESSELLDEESTAILRLVPRWQLTGRSKIELGLTGRLGKIDSEVGEDDTVSAWAADLTYSWCNFKAYGEVMQSYGVLNPRHYVTGGPSDIYFNTLAGAQYTLGPVTFRGTFSHGEYENPGGDQDLLLLGTTIPLSKWLTFMLEYVDWNVQPREQARQRFEDGFQFILHWHL